MKIRNAILIAFLALTIVTAFLLLTAAVSVGETTVQRSAPAIATATIPFDFWVAGTRLPAGEYSLYPVFRLSSVVLLRNAKVNAQEQVFLVPTGGAGTTDDYKLIFVTHKGQRYLHEVWKADGKAIVGSELGITIDARDARTEVALRVATAADVVEAAR